MLPIFYINLDSRPDRRVFMEQQFDRLGISAERVPAITSGEVPVALVAHIARPGHLWRLTAGDLACGLSHQKVWAAIVSRGLSEALVLEDDAVLDVALLPFLEAGHLQKLNAGLIRLETRRQPVALGRREAIIGDVSLRELGSTHNGTAAYLMSRDVAASSLGHHLVNQMALDRFLFGHGGPHLWRTKILQADPSPVLQLDRLHADLSRDGAAKSDIALHKKPRTSRSRLISDVFRLEGSLVLPRLRQLLRQPSIARRRKLVAFTADR
ncbi:glycosyltransferase family 25 protein [Devosia sp.]|uniref:glycosyltransferase family 25 protein n=1 Tax=Devosia sp. TaxID=1871048 RepID=UPI003BAA8A91